MARSVSWRRSCPEGVRRTMEELQNVTIYLLHQSGPTGFVVKMEKSDKKFKVLLGDVHQCTCVEHMKSKELCTHILWILLKRFRLSPDSALVFQLGLIEREINEIVYSKTKQALQKTTTFLKNDSDVGSGCVQKRPISADDVCPICQEDLLGSPKPLTYCRKSCGQSVHIKCMKIWADHQQTSGEEIVKCPLCREEFSTYKDLQKGMISSSARKNFAIEMQNRHTDTQCVNCGMEPITGRCYKCNVCSTYFLCQQCFSLTASQHSHGFVSRMHSSHQWRSVETPTPSQPLPEALVRNLEQRDITEEDYDLLLQLDRPNDQSIRNRVPHHILMKFPVEPLNTDHTLLQSRQMCNICMQMYVRGDWVKKLPCGHQFHRECVDSWLSGSHHTCPLDGLAVYNPQQSRRKKKKKNLSSKVRLPEKDAVENRSRSLPELLSVHGFSRNTSALRSESSNPCTSHSLTVSQVKQPELAISGLSLNNSSIGVSSGSQPKPPSTHHLQVSKRKGLFRLPPLTRPPLVRPQQVHGRGSSSFVASTSLNARSFVLQNNSSSSHFRSHCP